MSCSAVPSSSAIPTRTSQAAEPGFPDYSSMLKKIYMQHKETDAVVHYLNERLNKPLAAEESATILNYRAGVDYELTHYSCLHGNGVSANQFLPDMEPSWAAAFRENVERAEDSVLVRFILIYKAFSGHRSLSAWIINYLGLYLGLEPGFFYPLIDADGDFLPEDNKARGGHLKRTILYMEGHCFALCSVKRERMLAGSSWRPRVSELSNAFKT